MIVPDQHLQRLVSGDARQRMHTMHALCGADHVDRVVEQNHADAASKSLSIRFLADG